jgi:hypothetical protein
MEPKVLPFELVEGMRNISNSSAELGACILVVRKASFVQESFGKL